MGKLRRSAQNARSQKDHYSNYQPLSFLPYCKFWGRGQVVSDPGAPLCARKRSQEARNLRGRGSVQLGHFSIAGARPHRGLSPRQPSWVSPRGEFRHAAVGTAWQGACGSGWVGLLPSGVTHSTAGAQGDLGVGQAAGGGEFRQRDGRGPQSAGTPLAGGVPAMVWGLLTSQPGGLPATTPQARAPAPARVPLPGSRRVSHSLHSGRSLATHRSRRATTRAACRTCSAPPPPPPEAFLPPRLPRAPPPPGARPRSASPCGATRSGWAGLRTRAGGPGLALPVAAPCARYPPGSGAMASARALASGSIVNLKFILTVV